MISIRKAFAAAAIALTVAAGAGVAQAHDGNTAAIETITGKASWYGPGFHGRLTANGERFNQDALTAAHKTLPFGTELKVTNPNNGKSVVVRVNDRGPFVGHRVLDLSRGAAKEIGLVKAGVGTVEIEVLGSA